MVEGGLPEEDEIVIAGEVLEQEPQFPQGVDGDEMGVINESRRAASPMRSPEA